jgi:hypothetical protein
VAKPREVPQVPDADLGWLAGIIDGEGHIGLSHGGGSATPHLRVSFTNGSESILEKARGIYRGAGIRWHEHREPRGTTNVSVTQADALMLHVLLRPHLVRQVEQFDAAVSFLRRRYDEGRIRVRWTDVERAEWEQLRLRFHKGATSARGVA